MESKQYIYIGTEIKEELEKEYNKCQPDQVFILVDAITRLQCLPLLPDLHFLKTARIIEVPAGDDNKTLRSLSDVWLFLSKENASRKSLMINVGGGMITDLGGFAASTFKRGIKYMNIPTTLLGAVDAAVGGKTGINFNGFKNEIGVINPAESVLINVNFFKSLDRNNFLSGYAEMIKHGLISSDEIWNRILGFSLEEIDYEKLSPLLKESVQVKERIVEQDPMEKNIRKALNFGHTAGHAFESYAMEKNEPVLHGYAVAWGMIVELYLSYRKTGLPKPVLHQIVSYIRDTYGSFHITCKQYDKLYEYMTHDKKNEGKGQILFSLLKNIGDIQINVNIDKKDIFDALDFYRDSVGI